MPDISLLLFSYGTVTLFGAAFQQASDKKLG